MAAYGDTGKGSGYNSYARVSSIIRKATQDENPYLQFVTTEDVLGGSKKGDTIGITRKYDTTGGFPTSPLAEKSKIPVTDYVQDSVTLTLKEWGNRIDITEKLVKLSDFNEADKTAEALRDEWARWLSALFVNKMMQTSVKYTPITGTTSTLNDIYATASDYTATVTNGEAYAVEIDGSDPTGTFRAFGEPDLWNLLAIARDHLKMKPLSGKFGKFGTYALAVPQVMLNNLMRNSNISTALNYAYMGRGEANPLFKGYMGTYAGIGIILDTQNLCATVADNSEALFFGGDAITQAWATEPEIRADMGEGYNVSNDFGRDRGAAWYALGNYKFVGATNAAAVRAKLARAIHICPDTLSTPTEDTLT
jgi:hypothetical protein